MNFRNESQILQSQVFSPCSPVVSIESPASFDSHLQRCRSMIAAYQMLKLGFKKVSVLKGGFGEWKRNERPFEVSDSKNESWIDTRSMANMYTRTQHGNSGQGMSCRVFVPFYIWPRMVVAVNGRKWSARNIWQWLYIIHCGYCITAMRNNLAWEHGLAYPCNMAMIVSSCSGWRAYIIVTCDAPGWLIVLGRFYFTAVLHQLHKVSCKPIIHYHYASN